MARPHWYDEVDPFVMRVHCGDGDELHRVSWRDGRLWLLDHHPEAELVARALGGATPRCVEILEGLRDGRRELLPERLRELVDHVRFQRAIPPPRPRRAWARRGLTAAEFTEIRAADLLRTNTEAWTERLGFGRSRWNTRRVTVSAVPNYQRGSWQGIHVSGAMTAERTTLDVYLRPEWVLEVWRAGLALVDGCVVLDLLRSATPEGPIRVLCLRWVASPAPSRLRFRAVPTPARVIRGGDRWHLAWERQPRHAWRRCVERLPHDWAAPARPPLSPSAMLGPRRQAETTIAVVPRADHRSDSALNPRHRFDTFVEAPANVSAKSFCCLIAEVGAGPPGLWLVCGRAGLGKTHLLHAIAHRARSAHPDLCVRYVRGAQLALLTRGPSGESIVPASTKSLLLVDELERVDPTCAPALVRHLDALMDGNARVVLGSRLLPTQLDFTLPAEAMALTIGAPDLAARVAILRQEAPDASNELLTLLAMRFPDNIRVLRTALLWVQFHAQVNWESPSLAAAEQALRDVRLPVA